MKPSSIGAVYLLTFSVFTGLIGLFIHMTGPEIDPIAIILSRCVLATIFIFSACIACGKAKEVAPTSMDSFLLVALASLFIGACFFCFVTSVNSGKGKSSSSVANAGILLYCAPVFSIALSRLFFKEPVRISSCICSVGVLVGVVLIMYSSWHNDSKVWATCFGLASGLFYSCFGITVEKIGQRRPAVFSVFWIFALNSLIFFFVWNTCSVTHVADFFRNWWQLLSIGFVCTGAAYWFFVNGVSNPGISKQRIFLYTSFEPVVLFLTAVLYLKEPQTVASIAGMVLIFSSVILTVCSENQGKPRAHV